MNPDEKIDDHRGHRVERNTPAKRHESIIVTNPALDWMDEPRTDTTDVYVDKNEPKQWTCKQCHKEFSTKEKAKEHARKTYGRNSS